MLNQTLYRGGHGMWAWVAQRITGVMLFFFLFVHVADTALLRVSPDAYDTIIATYKTPIIALLEVGLVGTVLFHAFNGIRVILIDFWEKGAKYQKAMLWIVIALWIILMIPAATRMLWHTVELLFGEVA